MTWVTPGSGGARSRTVRAATPHHSLPSMENLVTQWKSARTVAFGRAWKAAKSQLVFSASAVAPNTWKSQLSGLNRGTGP